MGVRYASLLNAPLGLVQSAPWAGAGRGRAKDRNMSTRRFFSSRTFCIAACAPGNICPLTACASGNICPLTACAPDKICPLVAAGAPVNMPVHGVCTRQHKPVDGVCTRQNMPVDEVFCCLTDSYPSLTALLHPIKSYFVRAVKGEKVCFYITQYPVVGPFKALYTLSQVAELFIPTPTRLPLEAF